MKEQREPNLFLVNCPLCNEAIKEEKRNSRNFCPKCSKYYCSGCMKSWTWNYFRHPPNHHCIQTSYKGETKFKAEKFINHLEFLKTDFPKFMQTKIQQEEQLQEIRVYLDGKLERLKEDQELEQESNNEFIWFIDALNGLFIHFLLS